jgi:hypothetical protein
VLCIAIVFAKPTVIKYLENSSSLGLIVCEFSAQFYLPAADESEQNFCNPTSGAVILGSIESSLNLAMNLLSSLTLWFFIKLLHNGF